jgi:hypothetical protein
MLIYKDFFNIIVIEEILMSYSFSLLKDFSLDALKEMDTLKVSSVVSTFSNKKYFMVNYDKKKLTPDLFSSVGLARSIIFDETGKLLCFSPPKSYHATDFIKMHPDLGTCDGVHDENTLVAEEFIEGTMMNLFWDGESWEISTKKNIGATSSFYKGVSGKKKTFRTMFMEAVQEIGLDMNHLEKKNCYSFVLQHPDNRIVVQHLRPSLTLVDAYFIDLENKKISSIFHDVSREMLLSGQNIQVPRTYNMGSKATYTDLIETFASMNTPYYILGVVFLHLKSGKRTKIRNPVYEEVKNTNGLDKKIQYQYLFLRKEGKLKDYLSYFPENKNLFSMFRDQIHLYTSTLYQNYISCYIKKEKSLGEFPPQYRKHMFQLHKIYIETLREKKQHVSKMVVVDYINGLHPSVLMYFLNYVSKVKENDVAQCANIISP